jgi:hypothetical protein
LVCGLVDGVYGEKYTTPRALQHCSESEPAPLTLRIKNESYRIFKFTS